MDYKKHPWFWLAKAAHLCTENAEAISSRSETRVGDADSPAGRRRRRLGADADQETVAHYLEHEHWLQADSPADAESEEYHRILGMLAGDSPAATCLRAAIGELPKQFWGVAAFNLKAAEVAAAIKVHGLSEWERVPAAEQRCAMKRVASLAAGLAAAIEHTPLRDRSLYNLIPSEVARDIAVHVLDNPATPIYRLPVSPAEAIAAAIPHAPTIADAIQQLIQLAENHHHAEPSLLKKGTPTRSGVFIRDMADWLRTKGLFDEPSEWRPIPKPLSAESVEVLYQAAQLIFPEEVEDLRTADNYANGGKVKQRSS